MASNGKRFCRPKVNSPEILSHVARMLSGEVYRETKLINFYKIKSFCNKSRSLPYHETKQAEWMCNIPRSLNNDETKVGV